MRITGSAVGGYLGSRPRGRDSPILDKGCASAHHSRIDRGSLDDVIRPPRCGAPVRALIVAEGSRRTEDVMSAALQS
jgi:hypothetical protein